MQIIDIIRQLLPLGTDASTFNLAPTKERLQRSGAIQSTPTYELCPIWPPDLFAVVGTIIERSGCYTEASPDRRKLHAHKVHLDEICSIAEDWDDVLVPPVEVQRLWALMVSRYGSTDLADLNKKKSVVKLLLKLFAIADEACVGMGWGYPSKGGKFSPFATIALLNLTGKGRAPGILPHLPHSLCGMVSPDAAIVLPKSVTASVGCTIRSLSHYLALLPPRSVIEPQWALSTKTDTKRRADMRLLVIPFPFTIHADSFKLSTSKQDLGNGTNVAAYFKLIQKWLGSGRSRITGRKLVDELLRPLVETAEAECGQRPDGIILPECALSQELADEVVLHLAKIKIEFVIAGVLAEDPVSGRWLNQAKTFVTIEKTADRYRGAVALVQNKQHRWRLDKTQTTRYALDFDPASDNDKWWEDIDVSRRKLPFFALRENISLVTLICEDLARADPAMSVIRAVGPNLVVALLMDGPQIAIRWPGRYATVLAEDPGCAVLTVTCAAMVDRSNWLESKPARAIALWRDVDGKTQEIALPAGSLGMLLTLKSSPKHQTTIDNRSDHSASRKLTLASVIPLYLADPPSWI